MLICSAGRAPPPGPGTPASVVVAIRFHFVTSSACASVGTASATHGDNHREPTKSGGRSHIAPSLDPRRGARLFQRHQLPATEPKSHWPHESDQQEEAESPHKPPYAHTPDKQRTAPAGRARRSRHGIGSKRERGRVIMAPRSGAGLSRGVAPGGVEPPRTDSKSVALSAELRGRAQQGTPGQRQIEPA